MRSGKEGCSSNGDGGSSLQLTGEIPVSQGLQGKAGELMKGEAINLELQCPSFVLRVFREEGSSPGPGSFDPGV